jgi:hypothetical protein
MSHDNHGPSLPKIVDEAPDTPAWVPALGVGLLALITIVVAIRLAWLEANPVADPAGAAQAAASVDAGTAAAPTAE